MSKLFWAFLAAAAFCGIMSIARGDFKAMASAAEGFVLGGSVATFARKLEGRGNGSGGTAGAGN